MEEVRQEMSGASFRETILSDEKLMILAKVCVVVFFSGVVGKCVRFLLT